MKKNADKIADLYEKYRTGQIGGDDLWDTDGRLKTNDAVIPLVQPYMPEEFGDCLWLQDISFRTERAVQGSNVHFYIEAGLKEETLLTVDMVADTEKNILYLTIPQVNATPVSMEMTPEMLAFFTQQAGSGQNTEALRKSLPDRNTFREFAVRYLTLLADEMDTVEKEYTKISIGRKSRRVTALTAAISQADLQKAILTEMKDDPAILQFLRNYAKNTDTDQKTLTDLYQSAIDNALGDKTNTGTIRSTTYVDFMGNIIGRDIASVENGKTDELFHYYIVAKSRKNLQFDVYFEDIQLCGSYRKKSSKVTVDADVCQDGTEYLSVGLTVLENGHKTLLLTPRKAMLDALAEKLETDLPSNLLDGSLLVQINLFGAKTMSVSCMGEELVYLELTPRKCKEEVTIPNNSANVDNTFAIGMWALGADFKTVFRELEAAGVPDTVTDRIYQELFRLIVDRVTEELS